MKTRLIALIVLSLLICGVAAARDVSARAATDPSATLTVTKIADTADGVCDADCSLREAVAAAAGGDVIVFSPLFLAPQVITLTAGQIAITKKLTIDGSGSDLLTVSGNNASRIFHISGGVEVSLEGMKLANGLAGTENLPYGGAIYLTDSSLILTNILIRDNVARYTSPPPSTSFGRGGGIACLNSTLSVINSTISHNTTVAGGGFNGGGGIHSQYSNLTVVSSTISENTNGGILGVGLSSQPSTLNILNSNILNNTAAAIFNSSGQTTVVNTIIRNNGGGIGGGDSQSILTIDRCVISDNRPGGGIVNSGTAMVSATSINNNFANGLGARGGGLVNFGTMYVLNSSITNNRAFASGGGIFNSSGRLFLTNSTVSGNLADDGSGNCSCPGGGIHHLPGFNSTGDVILTNATVTNNRGGVGGGIRNDSLAIVTRNTIISGNFSNGSNHPAVDFVGTVVSQGTNLVGNTTGSSGWTTTDLLNTNPLLAALGNNGDMTLTHALLPGSPSINAGNNALALDPRTSHLLMLDQRGSARITGGTVDIGAYEANYSSTPVIISGRVTVSPTRRGISGARITLMGPGGTIYTQTNPFGYYRFFNLMPGTTFILNISHKSFQFSSPVIVTIDQNRSDLNFISQ